MEVSALNILSIALGATIFIICAAATLLRQRDFARKARKRASSRLDTRSDRLTECSFFEKKQRSGAKNSVSVPRNFEGSPSTSDCSEKAATRKIQPPSLEAEKRSQRFSGKSKKSVSSESLDVLPSQKNEKRSSAPLGTVSSPVLIDCPNRSKGCLKRVNPQFVGGHLVNECEFHRRLCADGCGAEFSNAEIDYHFDVCPKAIVVCVCSAEVERGKLKNHFRSECLTYAETKTKVKSEESKALA